MTRPRRDRSRSERTPSGAVRSTAVFDALPTPVALLDRKGRIAAVNRAWKDFGRDNGADAATQRGVSIDYLDVCLRAAPQASALQARDGIRTLLAGTLPRFELEYDCSSPDQERWFFMYAAPLPKGGAILLHVNTTEQKLLERRSLAETGRLEAIRAAEVENRRLQAELYEDVAQVLTGLQFLLAARNQGRGDLDPAIDVVRGATARVQELAQRLQPPEIEILGVVAAVASRLATEEPEAVRVRSEGREPDLPMETRIHLYRIAEILRRQARGRGEALSVHFDWRPRELVFSARLERARGAKRARGGAAEDDEAAWMRAVADRARLLQADLTEDRSGGGLSVTLRVPIEPGRTGG